MESAMVEKQKTGGAFDWWQRNVTNEIYLNTHRADWWKACMIVGDLIKSAKTLIDVGGGDGHTLWQILSVAMGKGAQFSEVTFVEPHKAGLEQAQRRLRQLNIGAVVLHRGTLESKGKEILDTRIEPFDVLYAGHVNYYFGKDTRGRVDHERYEAMLEMLPKLGKTAIIMTAPKESDYYKLVEKNPFSERAYSEFVVDFFKKKGFDVKNIDTPIRFYVAHALLSEHEAVMLWRFFNDSQRMPTGAELQAFRSKLRLIMDESGHVNIQDQLVVVTNR